MTNTTVDKNLYKDFLANRLRDLHKQLQEVPVYIELKKVEFELRKLDEALPVIKDNTIELVEGRGSSSVLKLERDE